MHKLNKQSEEFIQTKYDELIASGVPSDLAGKWAAELEERLRHLKHHEFLAASWIYRRAKEISDESPDSKFKTVGEFDVTQALTEWEARIEERLRKLESGTGMAGG